MKKCPDCNSEKIIQNAKAIDRGESNVNLDFNVAVDESPEAFIFKQRAYSEVDADICGEKYAVSTAALGSGKQRQTNKRNRITHHWVIGG